MKKNINNFKCIPYTVTCILVLIAFWGFKLANVLRSEINPESNSVGNTNGNYDINTEKPNAENPENNVEDEKNISGENTGYVSDPEIQDEYFSQYGSDDQAASDKDESDSGSACTDEETLNEFYEREYDTNGYPFCAGTLTDGYIAYEPSAVDSKYYSDAGKIALTSYADYVQVGDDYFDDACFIGDSRMVGIYDYSGWDNADFYCDNGFCVNTYISGGKVKCRTDNKNYTLEDAMKKKMYSKIYIMLGINDCGYATTEIFEERYLQMVQMIRENQPDAVIFLMANLHIASEAEKKDNTGVYTNRNVNAKNAAIAKCADTADDIYYLDYNSLFCDENGYLVSESSFDGFHLYARYYMKWTDYFRNHGIVK